jgi:hypothetical protein
MKTPIRIRGTPKGGTEGTSVEEALSGFAAVMSVIAVTLTSVSAYRLIRVDRAESIEDLALRFREPLLQAAYNLQSRLLNMARLDSLNRFLTATVSSPQPMPRSRSVPTPSATRSTSSGSTSGELR